MTQGPNLAVKTNPPTKTPSYITLKEFMESKVLNIFDVYTQVRDYIISFGIYM